MDLESADIVIGIGDTTDTAEVRLGSTILGYIPGAQDQMVESIALSGTTLTLTLAAGATAENTFTVQLIK